MQIKITPDKQKTKALMDMAKISLSRLNETDKEKYPTNTLTDYYDIIHKIMEAIAYIEGVKIKGEGAHQELIEYICKKYNIEEPIRIFLQELREYRNRISYEGFMINKEYIKVNIKKIEGIIDRFIKLTKF